MKISRRQPSAAYELYGFIPRVENGKHSAFCMSCNRILQNTAAVRLQIHRNACSQRHKAQTQARIGDPQQFPNLEIERHEKPEAAVYRGEDINTNIKTEKRDLELEDSSINYNANDNTTYEDDVEDTNQSRRFCVKNQNAEMDNIYRASRRSKEPCNTLYQEENPIQSPVAAQQPPEPFESYHANNNTSSTSVIELDDEIEEPSDENLINAEEDLDIIKNLMPRSKESNQLHDELFKAETEYYRCKAAYFTKLTENCSIKRTLMLLESRKLQLEIEKLKKES